MTRSAARWPAASRSAGFEDGDTDVVAVVAA
jgi:hypothetical protein